MYLYDIIETMLMLLDFLSKFIDISALFIIKLGKMPRFIMDKRRKMRYYVFIVNCGTMPRRKLSTR